MNKYHTATLKLRGYTVTVEIRTLGPAEQQSDCFIERGKFCASLECADAMGVLSDDNGHERSIDNGTLAQIRQWAEGHGY